MEPIEATNPESFARRVKAQDVNCTPWSEWITAPTPGFRLPIAIDNALVTNVAVCELSIDRPTTRREKTSKTTAQ